MGCIEKSCANLKYSRGLCKLHYQRHRNAGTLEQSALPSLMGDKSTQHRLSDIDKTTSSATCSSCGPDTSVRYRKNKKRYACSNSKTFERRYFLYGDNDRIPVSTINEARKYLSEKQNGMCAICKKEPPTLALDHCHDTGTIRGMLCFGCNVGLGHFQDNVEYLKNAIDYLSLTSDTSGRSLSAAS